MTQDVSATPPVQTVEFITTTRDDLFDVARLLARALDPDLLNVRGQPIVFTVNGSHSSGKKIISDVVFEEVGRAHKMVFNGRKGYDEFYVDPAAADGLQLSFIDLGFGMGYKTDSLREAASMRSSSILLAAFQQACRSRPGVAFLQNNKIDLPGMHIWIEDGMRDVWYNPREVAQLGKPGAEDATALFSAARAALQNRAWVRRVRIDITDPRLLQSSAIQSAVKALSAEAARVKKLLRDKKSPSARPFSPSPKIRI